VAGAVGVGQAGLACSGLAYTKATVGHVVAPALASRGGAAIGPTGMVGTGDVVAAWSAGPRVAHQGAALSVLGAAAVSWLRHPTQRAGRVTNTLAVAHTAAADVTLANPLSTVGRHIAPADPGDSRATLGPELVAGTGGIVLTEGAAVGDTGGSVAIICRVAATLASYTGAADLSQGVANAVGGGPAVLTHTVDADLATAVRIVQASSTTPARTER